MDRRRFLGLASAVVLGSRELSPAAAEPVALTPDPTGRIDSTAALVAAIAYAQLSRACALTIGPGTYRVQPGIVALGGIRLVGAA